MVEREGGDGNTISFKGLTYKFVAFDPTVLVHKRAPRPARPADILPSAVPFWPATGIFKKLEKALVAPSIGVVVAMVVSAASSPSVGTLKPAGQMSSLPNS
jgi:hypothetical protein